MVRLGALLALAGGASAVAGAAAAASGSFLLPSEHFIGVPRATRYESLGQEALAAGLLRWAYPGNGAGAQQLQHEEAQGWESLLTPAGAADAQLVALLVVKADEEGHVLQARTRTRRRGLCERGGG